MTTDRCFLCTQMPCQLRQQIWDHRHFSAEFLFQIFRKLQIHFHPVFAVLIIPLAAAIGLVWWPYRRRETDTAGVAFGSRTGRRSALLAAMVAWIATPLLIIADETWLQGADFLEGMPAVVGRGLLPCLLLAAAVFGFRLSVRKGMKATREDADQAVIVLLAVAFAIMTVVAFWFRGEGMALAWPW